MDKLREWPLLLRAVNTDELPVSLVGVRDECYYMAERVPWGERQEDGEKVTTTNEIRAMFRYAGLLEW